MSTGLGKEWLSKYHRGRDRKQCLSLPVNVDSIFKIIFTVTWHAFTLVVFEFTTAITCAIPCISSHKIGSLQ